MSKHKYNALTKSKEINTMKTPVILIFIIALFLASCSSTYQAGTPYDEVYATSDRKVTTVKKEKVTVTSTTVDEQGAYGGDDYYASDYDQEDFDAEGYYDYEYSSRIKRFNSEAAGFDYYDGYYTDAYQYTGTTNNYGTTIYSGCGGCYSSPSVSLALGFGWGMGYSAFGWGYPYYSWYRPYWYDPFYFYNPWSYGYYGYYPYYGYNSYWAGYNHGYWDGYYGSPYGGGYYYPSYNDYGGNYYYGPRGRDKGASDGSGIARGTGRPGLNQGTSGDMKASSATNRDARSVTYDPSARPLNKPGEASATRTTRSAATGINERTAVDERGTGTRTVNREGSQVTREVRQTQAQRTYEEPAEATRSTGNATQREVSSARRYEFPEQRYEKPKSYEAPKVRTTPSRNEYSSPSTRTNRGFTPNDNTRKTYIRDTERRPVETRSSNQSTSPGTIFPSTQPRESNRSYTAPARNNSNNRSYSTPSRSGGDRGSYSAPTRSSSSGYSGSSSSSSTRSSGTSGSSSSSSRGGGRR